MSANANDGQSIAVERNPLFYLSYLKPIIAIAAYMLVGPMLIFLNKYILNDLDFHFPAVVSSFGVLFSWIVSLLCVHVFKIIKLEYGDKMTFKFYMTRILPIAFFQVLTLLFGNWVYIHLSVSLIQMLKAFTPTLVMIMTYVFRISRPTRYLVLSTLCICFGTSLTSLGSIEYSIIGFVLMFAAEFFEALRLVLIQSLLGSAGWSFSVMEGLYWISPASLFWTWTVVIPMIEYEELKNGNPFEIFSENIEIMFLAGFLGFLVNIMGYFVIKTSSALVLKILSMVRNLGVILYSVVILREIVTAEQLIGMVISLAGFAAFNYLQMNKMGEIPFNSPQQSDKSIDSKIQATYTAVAQTEPKDDIKIIDRDADNSKLIERSHVSVDVKSQNKQ